MFSGISGTNPVSIFRVCQWFGTTKLTIISLGPTKPPAHPEYGKSVPKTSEKLHILMWQ
jgi:hypothetical protein